MNPFHMIIDPKISCHHANIFTHKLTIVSLCVNANVIHKLL